MGQARGITYRFTDNFTFSEIGTTNTTKKIKYTSAGRHVGSQGSVTGSGGGVGFVVEGVIELLKQKFKSTLLES